VRTLLGGAGNVGTLPLTTSSSNIYFIMKIETPLLITGCILICIGILIILYAKIPFFYRLPGNITIERKNFAIHFPLGLSLLASIILSLILNLIFNKK